MLRKPKQADPYHAGKPGARWAFMQKLVISSIPGDPYLTRWRIVHTPYFGILLHKIDRPDADDSPHDHPWKFVSIILKGGYTELVTYNESNSLIVKKREQFSVHTMPLGVYHMIAKLHRKPTWTLVLSGPRNQEWGFLDRNGRHVPWREYLGLDA